MTDRELLELAAKAAGIRIRCSNGGSFSQDDGEYWRAWNPLADDGDEARLESALRFDVDWRHAGVLVGQRICTGSAHFEYYCDHNGDKQAARRYAGVRAAAEIGKGIE